MINGLHQKAVSKQNASRCYVLFYKLSLSEVGNFINIHLTLVLLEVFWCESIDHTELQLYIATKNPC